MGRPRDAGGGVGLILVKGFTLKESARKPIELIAVGLESPHGFGIAFFDDLASLRVNQLPRCR